jgi:hypothetical protein
VPLELHNDLAQLRGAQTGANSDHSAP